MAQGHSQCVPHVCNVGLLRTRQTPGRPLTRRSQTLVKRSCCASTNSKLSNRYCSDQRQRQQQWRWLCPPPRAAGQGDAEVDEEDDYDSAEEDDEEGMATAYDAFAEEAEEADAYESLDEDVEDLDMKHWEEHVSDWWAFASGEGGVTAGMDVVNDSNVPWVTNTDKLFTHFQDALPRLQQSKEFIGVMPLPAHLTNQELNLDDMESHRNIVNPDWDDWDFRAYAEKDKRKKADRSAWNARRAAVGQYEYLHVNANTDVRLQVAADARERQWTNEEIWDLITLNGIAADPNDVGAQVFDPEGRADVLETGGEYIESTEEWLARKGHLLQSAPTQEDLDDLGVTQLAEDFAGLEQAGNTDLSALPGEEDAAGAGFDDDAAFPEN